MMRKKKTTARIRLATLLKDWEHPTFIKDGK